MSPAVWTNNPFPGECVLGGTISSGLRCWQRMENAMHDKYWSTKCGINKPWLGEEKGRWCMWRFVHPLMGSDPTHIELFLSTRTEKIKYNCHACSGCDPGRWDYWTPMQHIHRCKHYQLNTLSLSLTHTHTHTHCNQIHAWDKNLCKH